MTATEIHLVDPPHAGRQLQRRHRRHRRRRHRRHARGGGAHPPQALVEYFNARFQLYGRKIVLDYFDGQGSLGTELVGNGRDKAEVDATKVAEEVKPFADLTALTEPYADALARREILNFGIADPVAGVVHGPPAVLLERPAGLLDARRGGHRVHPQAARRARSATRAGGDLKGKPRKITALAPENSWYQECVAGRPGRSCKAAGQDFDVEPIAYRLDLTSMSNQAANLIPRLKAQGVTTLLCGCDPVFPIFLSGTANRERYYPEFVSGYEQDFIGQLWDPTFQRQSFGISPLGANNSQRPQDTIGYAAFKQMSDDEPAFSVDGLYYQLYMFAIGVADGRPEPHAGDLRAGDVRLPRALGPAGLWGFGPQDYTPMDDYHEMYWDADAVSTYNGQPGAWVDPNPGKRYRHGADELPPGEPRGPRQRDGAPRPPPAARARRRSRRRSPLLPGRLRAAGHGPDARPATRRSRWW